MRQFDGGALLLGLIGLSAFAAVAQAADTPVQLDIRPQPIGDALNEFAQQSGLQVVIDPKEGGNIEAPRLVGTYTPDAALTKLLANTGLRYEYLNDRTVAVRMAKAEGEEGTPKSRNAKVEDRRPLAVARAQSESLRTTEQSERGDYRDPATADQTRIELEEIVVTGSRLTRDTPEGTATVVVFDRERIEQLGVSNVADVLNYLPQQTFSFPESSNVAGAREIRLRGLGRGTTLVLINGRRAVPSAVLVDSSSFDLNTIPLAAVERIEVLTDSASAVYGSDAAGGVVNVLLKDGVKRPTIEAYYGTADGGATERHAALTLGAAHNRFEGILLLDYFDRDRLMGDKRTYYKNQDLRPFGGADYRVTTTNPANVCTRDGSNLPGLSASCAGVPSGSSGVGLTPADFAATAGQTYFESPSRYSPIIPQSRRSSAFARGRFTFANTVSMYGEVLYTDREHESSFSPATLRANVAASDPLNPFDVPVRVDYLFTGLGPRTEEVTMESYRAVLGVDGNIGDWSWDISALGFDEDGVRVRDKFLITSQANAAIANQSLNVFQDGPGASEAVLNSLTAETRAFFSSSTLQGTAFLRGPVLHLPSGSLDAVFGTEVRDEEIGFDRNEESPGNVLTPNPADRSISSAFVELSVPIVAQSQHVPFVERLKLLLAGRYDEYTDFGSTFNPQYGLQWYPAATLLMRASHGSSFRAPPLWNLYQPQQVLPGFIVDPTRNASVPVTTIRGGNRELQPEEGTSTTFGLVWTPQGSGSRFALSYWKIKLDQRVQPLSAQAILSNESLFSNRVVRSAPTPEDLAAGRPGALISIDSSTVNFGAIDTYGVDFEVSQEWGTRFGRFSAGAITTWVGQYESADLPGTPTVERVGVADWQGTVPKWRATSTLGWTRNGLSLSVTGRFVSAYDDTLNFSNVPTGREVASQVLVDLNASANLGEAAGNQSWARGLSVRMGITNLLDEVPNFAEVLGSTGFDASQADARQRFGYVSLTKTF